MIEAAAAEPAPAQTPDEVARALIEKARAVAEKTVALKRQVGGALRAAHEAQTREAISRTELTRALHATLVKRAALEAELRKAALTSYVATAKPQPLRRHNRLSRALDRLLARLGTPGRAAALLRSGVWRAGRRELLDYARRGVGPEAQARTLFDQAWYLASNPDVAAARTPPLLHYLTAGAREGRSPHPLFDVAHYRAHFGAEMDAHGLSPLEHYARVGAARGASPTPLFDVAWYLGQAPTLAPGEDPLSHYLRAGWIEGRRPHPLFDPAWYVRGAPDCEGPPLVHYLTTGWRRGVSPHPLFDPAWYGEHGRNRPTADQEPLAHYLASGGAVSPSPWFSRQHYVAARGAALAPGADPLIDYLLGGAWAVAEGRPGFPTAAYIASRPEAMADGVTPLEHWATLAAR